MTEADREYFRKFPDHAIRELLGHPENLRELVGAVAPQLVDGFDFSRMRPVEREFRLEDWRGREADRLFEVPYRDDEMEVAVLVCVLVEHQSAADPVMPLRMLVYAVLYWERQWKSWQSSSSPRDPLRINPVLPIVFHTGNRPWTTNRELSQLTRGPAALQALAPHWPPLFWDVAEKSPAELLRETGVWLRSLAVVRAERDDAESFLAVFRELLNEVERLTVGDEVRWHDLMRFVVSWGLRRRPHEESEQLKQAVMQSQRERIHQSQVQEMAETTFKSLEDHYDERATARAKELAKEFVEQRTEELVEQRAKILADERAEVQLKQARRADLKRLLERRFGDAPQSLLDHIDALDDSTRLQELFDQILDADSLDDLNF